MGSWTMTLRGSITYRTRTDSQLLDYRIREMLYYWRGIVLGLFHFKRIIKRKTRAFCGHKAENWFIIVHSNKIK